MPKKVLLLVDTTQGQHYELERNPPIKTALSNTNHYFLNMYDIDSLLKKFKAKNLIELNTNFYKFVLDNSFTHLLTVLETFPWLLPRTVYAIMQNGVQTGCVLGDDELVFQHNLNYLPIFNQTIGYTKHECEKYNKCYGNTYYLPTSTSIIKENYENQIGEEIDILFIGRPYGNRGETLLRLIKEGFNVKVAGDKSWLEIIGSSHYLGFVSNNEYNRTLRKSKIILGLMDFNGKGHLNGKLFDAAKVSRLAITSYYKPFISDYKFIEGEEFEMYRDLDELVNKVRFYLSDDQRRNTVARKLTERISKDFEYHHLYSGFFKHFFSVDRNLNSKKKVNVCIIREVNKKEIRYLDLNSETYHSTSNIKEIAKKYDFFYKDLNNAIYYESFICDWLYVFKDMDFLILSATLHKKRFVMKSSLLYDNTSVAIPARALNTRTLSHNKLLPILNNRFITNNSKKTSSIILVILIENKLRVIYRKIRSHFK